MKTIAFFNNKGGVGKTSLSYHVAWMLKEMGYSTLAVDLDPQANLTRMFISESEMEKLMGEERSIYSSLKPLMAGTGDIKPKKIIEKDENLGLIPGDLELSSVEGEFSENWPKCLDKSERAFRVITAFSRLIKEAGKQINARWAIIDMGPNLGAINRAVLIASDYVVLPLGPDLFSYQGLKNVGKFLEEWRGGWSKRKDTKPEGLELDLPEGGMLPLGYVMMRHSIRHDRPVKAYQKWMDKMPQAYKAFVLKDKQIQTTDDNPYMLAHLKDYRSLMPMAQEKNKPMFLLKQADGAIGSHHQAVGACYKDFKTLTEKILSAISACSH